MKTVIKNVKIYDGSGKKPYISDVLLSNEKIERIGASLDAENIIDGKGLCLAPGFIDAHTHSDSQLFVDNARKEKLMMGVTSEVGGQCGWSREPFTKDASPVAVDFFRSCLGNNIPEFESYQAFKDAAQSLNLGTHQKNFTGHLTLRSCAIGMENRIATSGEIKKMCDLLDKSMQEGSLGLSTGLVYAPSCYSAPEEIEALARVVKKHGGIYVTHMRNEASNLIEAVKEAISVARNTGVKLNISHLKVMYDNNFDKLDEALELIRSAIKEGHDITADAYPYDASSSNILSTLPKSYNSHGIDWLVEHLTGEENIEILRKNIYEPTESWANPIKNIGTAKMLITVAAKTPEAVGKTIRQYADMLGIDDIAAYAKLIAENRGAVKDVRFSMSEDLVKKVYCEPYCMVGSDGLFRSDTGLSHPRHFGTFTRFLGRYVRDGKIMSFEEGIRKATSMPAERYGFKNKGYIKEGYDADLVLFNENEIIDRAEYLDPFIPNEGIKGVFVMGEIAVWENEFKNVYNGIVY